MSLERCILCHWSSGLLTCEKCSLRCCNDCLNGHHKSCKDLIRFKYHMCNTHNDEQVMKFCLACNELICDTCLNNDHNSHSVLPIDRAFNKCRNYIDTIPAKLDAVEIDLIESRRIFEENKPFLNQVCELERLCLELVVNKKEKVIPQVKNYVEELDTDLEKLVTARHYLARSKEQEEFKLLFLENYANVQKLIDEHVKQQKRLANACHKILENVGVKHFNESLPLNEMFRLMILQKDKSLRGSSFDEDNKDGQVASVGSVPDHHPGYLFSSVSLNHQAETETKDLMVDDFLILGANPDISNQGLSLCAKPTCKGLKESIRFLERQVADMSAEINRLAVENSFIKTTSKDAMQRVLNIAKTDTANETVQLPRTQNKNMNTFASDMETLLNIFVNTKKELEQKRKEVSAIKSKLTAERAEKEKLRQFNKDIIKKLQQNQTALEERDQTKKVLSDANQIVIQLRKDNASLHNSIERFKSMITEKDKALNLLAREKDDLQLRLSSMAGNQLTKGNPNITDLSDPNRPMKIGDQFMELYDNEWTDAIECTQSVKSLFPDLKSSQIEEIVIRHLYQIITVCYKECLDISQKQVDDIDKAVNNMIPRVEDEDGSKNVSSLPGFKELMELRRQNSEKFANHLCEEKVMVNKIDLKDWLYDQKNEDLVNILTETPFFEICVHLCWYMVIQDPVMHLDEELIPDTTYDKSLYREFTCSGKKVRFVVWPALFLHKEGPVLCKGVVQAYS